MTEEIYEKRLQSLIAMLSEYKNIEFVSWEWTDNLRKRYRVEYYLHTPRIKMKEIKQ